MLSRVLKILLLCRIIAEKITLKLQKNVWNKWFVCGIMVRNGLNSFQRKGQILWVLKNLRICGINYQQIVNLVLRWCLVTLCLVKTSMVDCFWWGVVIYQILSPLYPYVNSRWRYCEKRSQYLFFVWQNILYIYNLCIIDN